MHRRIDELFGILYPEYETLVADKKANADRDKEFITNYIEKLSRFYDHSRSLPAERRITPQDSVRRGVNLMKMLYYLGILYPGFDQANAEQRQDVMNSEDRDLIEENIEQIDNFFIISKRNLENRKTEEQIVRDALAKIRAQESER